MYSKCFNNIINRIDYLVLHLWLMSELTLIQAMVGASHGKECLVSASFDHPAFVDHDNLIGTGNR